MFICHSTVHKKIINMTPKINAFAQKKNMFICHSTAHKKIINMTPKINAFAQKKTCLYATALFIRK